MQCTHKINNKKRTIFILKNHDYIDIDNLNQSVCHYTM